MQLSARYKINEQQVIQETIEGEAVIVNLVSGNYYSLDKVGAEIWGKIENGKSLDEILGLILKVYRGDPAAIETSVKSLIDELAKEGLIVPDAPTDAGSPQSPSLSTVEMRALEEFEAPVLKKYSDMQDLLLLDPIHEVDEGGWPNAKPNRDAEG
jgi:Coenzyme PQQ synthesis protein D (PqqD)